nr:MAG TPA: esterase [Crassvirales sp.]
MNFNLVEMYNGLLRFNKHILNELADKKADYNSKKGNDGQDTDKAVRVLLLGDSAHHGSRAGSGFFYSNWVRSASLADVGFFTTVKLD